MKPMIIFWRKSTDVSRPQTQICTAKARRIATGSSIATELNLARYKQTYFGLLNLRLMRMRLLRVSRRTLLKNLEDTDPSPTSCVPDNERGKANWHVHLMLNVLLTAVLSMELHLLFRNNVLRLVKYFPQVDDPIYQPPIKRIRTA